MDYIKQRITSIKRGLKDIHTKKPYLEFFAALLTIPVLLTVIILNVNNLKGDNKKGDNNTSKNQTIVITQPTTNTNSSEKEVIVTKEACTPGIGDISIDSPEEGEVVSDNPVMIDISYKAGDYCAVVWSYRVNGGTWSSYDDRSIALSNLQNGEVKFDLRVKSVVNSDTSSLSKTFTYKSSQTSPTPSPTLTPTPTL